MRKLTLLTFAATLFFATKLAAAQSFEFPVERERMLRDHRGTLVITPEKIEYKTEHKGESRSWRYVDIQQIKIESPTELEIMTYEDKKRMLGRDRIFKFKLLEGKITPEISALLVARATRPVATSIMPVADVTPQFEIPVKHLHTLGGCQGMLKIYPDRVIYESADEPKHSRYWRYADIRHFGHPARYQFEITTFEEKFGGPTKVYNFDLKEAFPAPAYDYLWVRVNPMELYPYEKAVKRDALAADVTAAPESPRPERPAVSTAEAAPKQQEPGPQLQKQAEAASLRDNDETARKPQAGSDAIEARPRQEISARKKQPAVQTAKVMVTEQGYSPASIRLRRGIPARVTFVRQVDGTCGTEIVLPEQGIKRALPLNKPVVVGFTPNKSGEFGFTCGMGMLRGKVIVQER
jgi:hypothetical protein